jgi:hypothetical protein
MESFEYNSANEKDTTIFDLLSTPHYYFISCSFNLSKRRTGK